MAGAPFNQEFITRGEFQNVVQLLMGSLNKIDNSVQCISADAKTLHAEIDTLKEALGKLNYDYEERKEESSDQKEDKRDNKLAVIGFFSGVASTVISALILIVVAGK